MLNYTFRFVSRQHHHILPRSIFRRYASNPTSGRTSQKAVPKVLPPQLANQAYGLGHNEKKLFNAKNLFEKGISDIYRAPRSQISSIMISWSIGASCMLGVFFIGGTRLWDSKAVVKQGLGSWVAVSYRFTMVVMTGLGAWCLYRTRGFITALTLVKKTQFVELQVSVRRAIPFLKPRKFVIPPYDFQIDRYLVATVQSPGWIEPQPEGTGNMFTRVLRGISRGFYVPFALTRQTFTQEGILNVSVADSNGKKDQQHIYKLDTNGLFSNEGKDLINVATLKD